MRLILEVWRYWWNLNAVMWPYSSCSWTLYGALFKGNSRKPDTYFKKVYSDLFIFSLRCWNGPPFRSLPRHCSDIIMNTMAPAITDCLDYFLNRVFRRRSKKTSKLRVTGLWKGYPQSFDSDNWFMLFWHKQRFYIICRVANKLHFIELIWLQWSC